MWCSYNLHKYLYLGLVVTGREICGISGPCSVGGAFASAFFILHFEMDVLPVHCHLFLRGAWLICVGLIIWF